MSEEPNKLPDELSHYAGLEAQVTSNGHRRVYGVDENGKKTVLQNDNVLAAYGYTDDDLPSQNSATIKQEVQNSIPSNKEIEKDPYDEYLEEVRSGEASDIAFNDWSQSREKRKAAKWYTNTRSHGDAYMARSESEEDTDEKGAGDIGVDLLNNEDHQTQLNSRENRTTPSQDDVEYYAWLKKNSGSEPTKPAEETGPQEPLPSQLPPTPDVPLFTESIEPQEKSIEESIDDILGAKEAPLQPEAQVEASESPPDYNDDELLDDPEYQELREEMDIAREEFASLAARRRGATFGFYSTQSRLERAEARYCMARDRAGAYVANYFEKQGRTTEEIRHLAIAARALEAMGLTKDVLDHQLALAEGRKLKGFYDWWARQGGHNFFSKAGLKGNLKKGLAMAAIGFIPGIGLGMVGAAVLGPAVGGVLGASLASRVGRGIMGAKIDKNAESPAVATVQNNEQFNNDLDRFYDNPDDLGTTAVTEGVMDLTERSIDRNRGRVAKAASVAAIAGVAGGIAGHYIHDIFRGNISRPNTGLSPTSGAVDSTPAVRVPEIPNFGQLDDRMPWTHFADRFGANSATPRILAAVEKARSMGWQVEGNGQGGGQGAIVRIVAPNGTQITDISQMNLLLDYFDAA